MAWLLLVVARSEPARHKYLKHIFASDVIDVIVDRRVDARRQRQEPVAVDKRREERRQRDIAKELETTGWAVVRR
jgi:hypothetical protein